MEARLGPGWGTLGDIPCNTLRTRLDRHMEHTGSNREAEDSRDRKVLDENIGRSGHVWTLKHSAICMLAI